MRTIQTATCIQDFEEMAATASNMVEGEYIARCAAKFANGDSSWKRDFCLQHLSRFAHSKMYKILIGQMDGDKSQYYYVPSPL